MSDPIEIIQTVISVAKRVQDAVNSIKSAPDELKSLDHEVSRVLPILGQLVTILGMAQDREQQERDEKALQSLCDEARELIDKTNGFLQIGKGTDYKLRKKDWHRWLLQTSDRREVFRAFQRLYSSINVFLSYEDLRKTTELASNVQALIGKVDTQSNILQSMQRNVQATEDTTVAESSVQEPLYKPSSCVQPPLYPESSMPATQRITVQDLGSCDRCPPCCRCRCHSKSLTIGNLLIRHDWLSTSLSARTPCNDQCCKRYRPGTFQLRYCFPSWFPQINAEIRTEYIPIYLHIQTPRPVRSLVWLQVATLDQIKEKLCKRELTVNDVENGESLLHFLTWRLTVDRSEAVLSILGFLAEHSCPSDWEWKGLTPTENAVWFWLVYWRHYGSREVALEDLKFRLGPYLPQCIEDAWEAVAIKLCWSDMHRCLCAPSTPSIISLRGLEFRANAQDPWGFTPLFYAMLNGPEATNALLLRGANPRIDSYILAWATQAGADSVISLLVRAGADTNSADADDRTALHWAAIYDLTYSINGLAVALELVRHARHMLKWHVQNKRGQTPLTWAQKRAKRNPTDEDSQRILEIYRACRLSNEYQYLPSPAISEVQDDIDEHDDTGLPPTSLIRAGLRGDVNAIGDLIKRGAMVNECDNDDQTLLHLIASGRVSNGYRVALELVRHGGWGIDWDSRTINGKTALDIVQGRLEHEELDEREHVEATNIHALIQAQRLPPGEKYLWPCMDPDFYQQEPALPIPGGWNNN